jgi:hypothetical protein
MRGIMTRVNTVRGIYDIAGDHELNAIRCPLRTIHVIEGGSMTVHYFHIERWV